MPTSHTDGTTRRVSPDMLRIPAMPPSAAPIKDFLLRTNPVPDLPPRIVPAWGTIGCALGAAASVIYGWTLGAGLSGGLVFAVPWLLVWWEWYRRRRWQLLWMAAQLHMRFMVYDSALACLVKLPRHYRAGDAPPGGVLVALGDSYAYTGRRQQALDCYRAAVRNYPESQLGTRPRLEIERLESWDMQA